MGLLFEVIAGGAPLVQRVWSATSDAATDCSSVVKTATGFCVARVGGELTVHLRGPETNAGQVAMPEDSELFGLEFVPGAYLPMFPPTGLTDRVAAFPTPSADRVVLDNRDWELPTVHNIDVFVDRLVRADLIAFDPLVDEIRYGEQPSSMSERTAQSRFRRGVGMSRRKFLSVERARQAARLLTDGALIAQVVDACGYYDHAQLSRAMRWATGHSPSELRAGVGFLAF